MNSLSEVRRSRPEGNKTEWQVASNTNLCLQYGGQQWSQLGL